MCELFPCIPFLRGFYYFIFFWLKKYCGMGRFGFVIRLSWKAPKHTTELYSTDMFLNMSLAKVYFSKIVELLSTMIVSFCKMHRFWGQTELQNFLSSKSFVFQSKGSWTNLIFGLLIWSLDPLQRGCFFKR